MTHQTLENHFETRCTFQGLICQITFPKNFEITLLDQTCILQPPACLYTDFGCICHFQLFFEDSVRNTQAGKRVGLHTVLVSYSFSP